MFPSSIKPFSQAPVPTPEVEPLLSRTVAASTSQQPENKNFTPPGSKFPRAKASWLHSALGGITGNTLLHQAVQEGDLAKVQFRLGKHDDPGRKNSKGQTPLDLAVEKGHVEIVKVLLANPNVRPEVADNNGRTLLHHAVEKGDVEIVKAVLDHHRVRPDAVDGKGRTGLSYAAEKGRFDIIAPLLEKGANPNLRDKNGLTPLAYAVKNDHRNATATILQKTQFELGLNVEGGDGKTLLHRAVENKRSSEITALLLEQGGRIDPNIPDFEGLTPLASAAREGNFSAVQALLRSPTVEINKADREGNTALHHAVKKNDPGIIELLLQDNRIDPNVSNSEDLTPLVLAVQDNTWRARAMQASNDSALHSLLKSQKVEINKADRNGNTALHHAVEKDDPEIIDLFLKQGSSTNPNLRNSEGLTPIALAAQKDSSSALRILMDNGRVDVNLPNHAGETPFFIAAKAYATTALSDKVIPDKGFNMLLGIKCPPFSSFKFRETRVDYFQPRNDGVTPLQYLINIVHDVPGRCAEDMSRKDRGALYYLENMISNEHIRKDISRDIFDQALSVLKAKNYSSYDRVRERI